MRITSNIQIPGPHGRPLLIDFYYLANDTPKPIVIFAHGFKGFKDWGHWDLIAEEFARNGFVFVKFNFSHNGTTPSDPENFADLEAFGNNNFSIELDDLGRVIDFVLGKASMVPPEEMDVDQLSLIGHSRGGGIVILKANEDPRVKKLATWASVSDYGIYYTEATIAAWQKNGVIHIPNARTGQEMPLYWQLWENYQANTARLDIRKAAENIDIPLLVVHGTADPTVPHQSALDLQSWHGNAELLTIEGGDHVFGGKHPWESTSLSGHAAKVTRETMRFFKQ